jgi:hypothetical protein
MANEPGGGPSEAPSNPNELPQHPLVERLKPDPSQPAKRVVVLTGLPGKSDRNGFQRLYLTTKLNYYAEFLASDIVNAEVIPADQSPFPGHEATRVSVARDATIHYIRERSPQPVDEFDLDVRLGAPAAAAAAQAQPALIISPPNGCIGRTDNTCRTQCGTCRGDDTCPITQCGGTCPRTACGATCAGAATCQAQATCAGHGTCVNTQCLQAACIFTPNNAGTCVTCVFTQCGQATCANTNCQQQTCITCPAAATCPQTCVA